MDDQERWYRDNIDFRGEVVADVGANVGRLSQFFWEAGDAATRVVSIEPLADNVAAIEARIRHQKEPLQYVLDNPVVETVDGPRRVFDHVLVNEDLDATVAETVRLFEERFLVEA